MDWVRVENNWDQYRAKVKARWAKLSPMHLDDIAGDRTRLVSAVREIYKLSSEEVEKQVRYFEERNHDYRPESSSCSKWRRVTVSADQRPQEQ